MKKICFIISVLISAFVLSSCSKDEDEQIDSIDDIPTGKVALDKYGMKVLFPDDGWGNSTETKWENLSQFARECVATFLKEDTAQGGAYTSVIYFSRFKDECQKGQEDSLINDYHVILSGLLDEGENDPNLIYTKLSYVEFATIADHAASRIETSLKSDFYQDNYFIQNGNNLYMVTISIADSLKNTKKYKECLDIVNTLKFK